MERCDHIEEPIKPVGIIDFLRARPDGVTAPELFEACRHVNCDLRVFTEMVDDLATKFRKIERREGRYYARSRSNVA